LWDFRRLSSARRRSARSAATDAELVQHALEQGGFSFSLTRVELRADFLRELKESPPDLILLDYYLPGFDGVTALGLAQEKYPDIFSLRLQGRRNS